VHEHYGRGIYPCIYCDGWELRDQPLGAFGSGDSCSEFALGLTTWSHDVVWFTNGPAEVDARERERLARYGVRIQEGRVLAFEGNGEDLDHVVVEGGVRVARRAVFLHLGQRVRSPLADMLGCGVDEGMVETFEKQRTAVPGLYFAGDASHDVKFAIVAAAHGARAAHDINQALRQEDTP
jgi:thioredoxin reductase